ncbi:nucleoside triphosphate pyrophosphohydrolase [Histidinibacterium aquaticum]|uniref:Nucleoside triphosphate pyrophosphohydrolase n=1 Tax=Histidinibacterium aquaticum TaxID=2613962 RepID=A0A5J5GIN6_9RHOB|nr:nucleoside triphosphate pyrophosphohydrolase [Histidinibacterium aquaticum]KAA9008096.1 nucleoside triphosphate pyrophosphohydrolase [Histidinibacterium aquaticum]
MWFCGVPQEYGIGRNVPWYRARETADAAPRVESKYKDFTVSRPDDLSDLPIPYCTIRLLPSVEYIRDESFLDKVIDVAKANRVPVKIEGSVLGHIYYRLCQAGVGVIIPRQAKYRKAPEKKIFGKIVRDRIPENIRKGGEEAVEATLRREDIDFGLGAKLIEELDEFLTTDDANERKAELADMLEVIMGLAAANSISWSEVISIAEAKREKSGGFERRRVLMETSLPSSREVSERRDLVSLSELSHISHSDRTSSIPFYSVLARYNRNGVSLRLKNSSAVIRVGLKNGRLLVTEEKTTRDHLEDGSVDDQFSLPLFD